MYSYKNHCYTPETVVTNLSDPLQFCIDIANKEVLTHIAYPISFVNRAYELYLAAEEYRQRLSYVEGYPRILQDAPKKQKKLTKAQFIKKLDSRVQRIVSLKTLAI